MRAKFINIMVLSGILGFLGCRSSNDPSHWSSKKIDKWFGKGDWLNGWNVRPDESINRKEFAVSYFRNKERWDKAFIFLKNSDLSNLELKRYDLDGDNLYASVNEYITKNIEVADYEAHRKYIDIQYIITGKELIGVSPAESKTSVLTPYDEVKDVEFISVREGVEYKADPGRVFIFFPSDAHRPNLKDGENSMVRKVVIKVKVD